MSSIGDISKKADEIKELFQEINSLNNDILVILKSLQEAKKEDITLVVEDEKKDNDVTVIEEEEDLVGDSADFYYKSIYEYQLKHSDDDIKMIEELLPDVESYNYNKIILRIIAEFKLEIYEYRGEVERLKNECSLDELKEYINEIKDLNEKITIIQEINKRRAHVDNDKKCEKIKNKLVFMNKSNDKAYALKDLENIPNDYYYSFLDLLSSIVDGTFKNVKFLSNTNNKLSGIVEVKDFKIRILFDRIAPHVFCIIACFMKKSDNDKDYREFCINRISTYNVKKNSIVSSLNDPDVIKQNEDTMNEIYTLLGYDFENDSKRGG